jgi:hypothetical protein
MDFDMPVVVDATNAYRIFVHEVADPGSGGPDHPANVLPD